MPTHSETRTLPYSARQMYDLVADVTQYPKFLPWCAATRVRSLEENGDGTFLLFVTPPSKPPKHRFKRSVIFLLDRSGSMTGEPFQEAAKALQVRGVPG